MSKLTKVSLRLLGPFAVEANVGRPIEISVRAKKARGLLAYLSMKLNYRARREELATLFWGDSVDASARHSLRQCLISLRQDLSIASEALIVVRDSVALDPQFVSVDARRFSSLARSGRAHELTEAAALWRDGFLPDLVMDIEEFDAWRMQEAERLSGAAADVFEAICRHADAEADGEAALVAVERLIALEPTREDRQRIALKLLARYKGREAALSRAKSLANMLRREISAPPEAATQALIAAIQRGDFAPAAPRDRAHTVAEDIYGGAVVQDKPATAKPPADGKRFHVAAPSQSVARSAVALQAVATATPGLAPVWRRRRLAVAFAALAVAAAGSMALLVSENWAKLSVVLTDAHQDRTVAVLPFVADGPASADEPTFARALTHDLIGYLSRFGNLRVVSEPASDLYRSRQSDANPIGDLGAQYAVVGHVQRTGPVLKIDFQLVNTATQTNVWSDGLQRERSEPNGAADEVARGIARMLAMEVDRLAALQIGAKPNSQLTVLELIGRGYLAAQRGATRESLSAAMQSFDEALRRNPDSLAARLAVARVQILATMNFIDLVPAPDLDATERLLGESLRRFPNSISALYSLALLQKQRHQYEASLRTLQRCLELNPSFLPAQGQIGDLLTRTGQPEKGLQQILQTINGATSNDPSLGHWYLFAAEAELQLGHDRAALNWALRADTFMPGSPLVLAWLASIYSNIGDVAAAAKYAAALRKAAPTRTELFLKRSPAQDVNSAHGLRIFQGLRLALATSPADR